MNLTREAILKLKEAGRYDLILISYINESGYAGIMPETGEIVDRRYFNEAIPVQKNQSLGIPEPKKI